MRRALARRVDCCPVRGSFENRHWVDGNDEEMNLLLELTRDQLN